jgi:hypothetical protein
MKSTIIRILVLVAASTALLPTTAVAARSPKPSHSVPAYRSPVMPKSSLIKLFKEDSVAALREARGFAMNPGPPGNDYAPHWQP